MENIQRTDCDESNALSQRMLQHFLQFPFCKMHHWSDLMQNNLTFANFIVHLRVGEFYDYKCKWIRWKKIR